MKKEIIKTITYSELVKELGDVILNNYILEFAYKHGLSVEVEQGELIRYFNDEWEEISQDEYYEIDGGHESDIDIYQYFIISDYAAEYLERHTEEIIFYIEELNMYIWGVSHFGMSWDMVELDIKTWEYC